MKVQLDDLDYNIENDWVETHPYKDMKYDSCMLAFSIRQRLFDLIKILCEHSTLELHKDIYLEAMCVWGDTQVSMMYKIAEHIEDSQFRPYPGVWGYMEAMLEYLTTDVKELSYTTIFRLRLLLAHWKTLDPSIVQQKMELVEAKYTEYRERRTVNAQAS